MVSVLFAGHLERQFAVVRFTENVLLERLRLVPAGLPAFASHDALTGTTQPAIFTLDVFVHALPLQGAHGQRVATVIPLQLYYDASSRSIIEYELKLPPTTRSRLIVFKGAYEALTVVLYGRLLRKQPAPAIEPSPLPAIKPLVHHPSLPPKPPAQEVETQPTVEVEVALPPSLVPLLPLLPAPDTAKISKLIHQRPKLADALDLFRDVDLEIAVSLYDGDRQRLGLVLRGAFGKEEAIGTKSERVEASWQEAAKMDDFRLASLPIETWASVLESSERRDWTIEGTRTLWSLAHRQVSAMARFASLGPPSTKEALVRISTLLDETADADANQPFDALLSLLQTSSERPANLPALASEPLISVLLDNQDESHRRRLDANASIVGLLGALTEADDLLALVSFCRTSDNPEATARYFRQGDFLVNLDPLLAECVSDELVDAVLYLICSLLLTSSGIAYLVLHLESPGSLASWLVSIGEGSEERDILLALESVRLREIITNKAVGRLAVGLVATTAVAAGIDSDDSKGCSAMLQVIATYPAYRPLLIYILSLDALFPLLVRQATASQRLSIWRLATMVLSEAHLHPHPLTLARHLEVLVGASPSAEERIVVEAAVAMLKEVYGHRDPLEALTRTIRSPAVNSLPTRAHLLKTIALAARAAKNAIGSDKAAQPTLVLAFEVERALEQVVNGIVKLSRSVHGELELVLRTSLEKRKAKEARLRVAIDAATALLGLLRKLDAQAGSKVATRAALHLASLSVAPLGGIELMVAASIAHDHALALLRRAPIDPSTVLSTIEAAIFEFPRLATQASELLLLLLPIDATASTAEAWCRALAGSADLIIALGNSSLLGRAAILDSGPRSIGLVELLADVAKDQPMVDMPALLDLVQVRAAAIGEGMSRSSSVMRIGEAGAVYSVKAYRGDAFRLQANEQATPLLRPPSTHVDAFSMRRLSSG